MRASKGFAILMPERRPAQRWATQLCFRKTTPFWTKEMATPHTDTHVREQTRRDEQARKNGDAARAGVEKLADFRQQATEDAWKSMESSVDAASRGFQNASDQFARTLGFSGEEGERLGRRSRQEGEGVTQFGPWR